MAHPVELDESLHPDGSADPLGTTHIVAIRVTSNGYDNNHSLTEPPFNHTLSIGEHYQFSCQPNLGELSHGITDGLHSDLDLG